MILYLYNYFQLFLSFSGIFTLLDFLFVVITFSVHVYIFVNEQSWSDSFKEYI